MLLQRSAKPAFSVHPIVDQGLYSALVGLEEQTRWVPSPEQLFAWDEEIRQYTQAPVSAESSHLHSVSRICVPVSLHWVLTACTMAPSA